MRFLAQMLLAALLAVVGLSFVYSHLAHRPPAAISLAGFDRSLGIQDLGQAFVCQLESDQKMRSLARCLMSMRKEAWKRGDRSKIPHSLHQIWPYETPLPDELARSSMLLIEQHPSFSYKLWRLEDFGPLLEKTLGETWKTLPPYLIRDLAAAHILMKEGGIIVDLEEECVQPITELVTLGDCIIGFEPPLPNPRYSRRLFLSPSLLAATPDHCIISLWIQKMSARIQSSTEDPLFICTESLTSVVSEQEPAQSEKLLLVGPTFFTPVAPPFSKDLRRQLDGVLKRSMTKKISTALHIGNTQPFSTISDETIFVHMYGGRQSRRYFEGNRLQKVLDKEEAAEP